MQPDLDLVRTHWPALARPRLDALFALDAAMGQVLRTTSEPMIGAIRLSWWRERLAGLDANEVPAEPRLQAAAGLRPQIAGADLAGLEAGWAAMLQPFPWGAATIDAIGERGAALFTFAARLLAVAGERLAHAGRLWALVDAARHCSDPASRDALIVAARALPQARFPFAQRPLSALAALAARDLRRWPEIEPEGTPGRAMTLVRHRLTGRL